MTTENTVNQVPTNIDENENLPERCNLDFSQKKNSTLVLYASVKG